MIECLDEINHLTTQIIMKVTGTCLPANEKKGAFGVGFPRKGES